MALCQYWSCEQVIKEKYVLCYDHYGDFSEGLLNKCPNCGKFKKVLYDLCLSCAQGLQGGVRTTTQIERDPAWEKKDAEASEFFVYILKQNGKPRFYIGHTRDLEERMMEHSEDKVPSTKGRTPKLYYFERQESRESAAMREAQLKELFEKDERELRKIIVQFQNYLEWIPRIDDIQSSR